MKKMQEAERYSYKEFARRVINTIEHLRTSNDIPKILDENTNRLGVQSAIDWFIQQVVNADKIVQVKPIAPVNVVRALDQGILQSLPMGALGLY